jgi:TonB-dependent Receptor Plug Domain
MHIKSIQIIRSLFLILIVKLLLFDPSSGQAQEGPPQEQVAKTALPRTTSPPSHAPAPSGASPSDGSSSIPVSPISGVHRVQSTVEVNASLPNFATGMAAPYQITQDEVLSSAGTWGDFSRYLQLLPGVVWNTDMSNDIMVRGGNPSENLFVVDGIEVPNINHLALEGGTGGFTSMIDTTAIRSVDMKAGAYDASYSSRLSSLIEIHTRDAEPGVSGNEVDVGISGAGGMFLRPIGSNGDVQLSVHRSILNLATNDIGLNGVPVYTNIMAKSEWSPGSRDHFRALSLTGTDSIDITPEPCDGGVTLDVQTQYSGWRSTDGLVWQHTHTEQTLSTVTVSYSAQNQQIGQQLQSTPYIDNWAACKSNPYQTLPVYSERTSDRTATLKYGLLTSRNQWTYSAGGTAQFLSLDYAVNQPVGQQSPFNPDPDFTDADNFAVNPIVEQGAAYIEASGPVGTHINAMAAIREEIFGLTGAHAFEPRASLALRITGHQSVNGTYSRSSQLAPSIDILSYPGNRHLLPINVEQYSLGASLWQTGWLSLSADAYHKRYFDEPVSTEYPSLMLANMVDMLGQQFVWLPLKTGGRGTSEGIELFLRAHATDRLSLLGSATYSRTRYAAADGILRPGNFDFPLVANGMVTVRLPAKLQLAVRDTYASGRPHTPYNITLSEQQSRGIYDLTQINALRGPAYNRLDIDMNRNFLVFRGFLNVHAGVENVLNRQNFLGYAWESNCGSNVGTYCGLNVNVSPGIPETKVTQMPIFPSAGVRYSF